MGKKSKRWRSRAQRFEASYQGAKKHWVAAGLAETKAQEQIRALQAEVERLKRQVEKDERLACFRVAVRDLPFGRMGGEVVSLQVSFDPRMIEYGLLAVSNGRPYELSSHVAWMVEDLTYRIRRELLERLTKDSKLNLVQ